MSTRVPVTGRILAYTRIVVLILALAWCLGILLLLSALFGERESRGFLYRRKFTRAAMAILGVKLTLHGTQSEKPALYVSNHRSMLDPVIQLRYIDAYIVSKAEVEKYPLVGRGAHETGVVFVKRDSKESRAASRDAIRALLADNKSVLIYPEGTTSNVPTTQMFRTGAFDIAAELGVPVIPVAIRYSDPNDNWADGPMLPFFIRKFAKRKIVAEMWIGDVCEAGDSAGLVVESRRWINEKA